MSGSNATDPSSKAQEVMEYLSAHELTQRLNDIVNNTVRARADDPFAFMAQQFLAIAQAPTISHVTVSNVLDADGLFRCAQADVFSWQPASFIHMGRGFGHIAGEIEDEAAISTAVSNPLKSKALKAESLEEIDKILSDQKQGMAAVAITAVSFAVARAIAHATRQDLFAVLKKRIAAQNSTQVVIPMPLIDVVNSSGSKFGYFGICPSSPEFSLRQCYRAANAVRSSLESKLAMTSLASIEVKKADELLSMIEQGIVSGGSSAVASISIWFDANAETMYNAETEEYEIGGGASVSREELLAQYQTMTTQHPALMLIIDPFHSSDTEGFLNDHFLHLVLTTICRLESVFAGDGKPMQCCQHSNVDHWHDCFGGNGGDHLGSCQGNSGARELSHRFCLCLSRGTNG
jgi:hypothetical protein